MPAGKKKNPGNKNRSSKKSNSNQWEDHLTRRAKALTPPVTFIKISRPERFIPSLFSMTATIKETLWLSRPKIVRRGVPRLVLDTKP